jgi:hypothetical protein
MTHSSRILLLTALLVPSVLSAARAGTITGRVVGPNGSGVPNVNIDGDDLINGGNANISNDSTDANGNFTATIPDGQYRLYFKPPHPPTTTFLTAVLDNVVVNGSVNLGTITLEQGISLSGHVNNANNQALANVNLDVLRKSTELDVFLTNDFTDGAGNFVMAVPIGPIEVRFLPPTGTQLAPTQRKLNRCFDTNMGTVKLSTGFTVTAIVRRSNGTAVQGADIDAVDSTTGEKQFTPGDNTDNNGFVDFVLKAGTYDIEFGAPSSNSLVTKVLPDVVVSATKNLGVVTLVSGVTLSGHVQSQSSAPIAKVDLDFFLHSTGAPVDTSFDDTDANGDYQAVVPTGTYDVLYTSSFFDPYATKTITNLVISSNKTQNVTLAPCDGVTQFGSGSAGTGGRIPAISAEWGYLRIGNPDWTVEVSNGRGGATAFLFVSAGPDIGGLGGGAWSPLRQLGKPTVFVLTGASGAPGAGSGCVNWPLPLNPELVGLEIHARVFVTDPQASGGFAATKALVGTFCD